MAFGSCAERNAFFFLSPTPLLRSVSLFFRLSCFSHFISIIFCFEFKLWHPCLPQDVCHKLQSNVVTMIFFFFLPVPFYDLVFSFLSFFLFFPSRSGASDVKQPRYGFVLFLLLFFWVGNKKNALFAQTFPPQLFYTNLSLSTHCSFFPSPIHCPILLSPSSPFMFPPFILLTSPCPSLSCPVLSPEDTPLTGALPTKGNAVFLLLEMMICCEMSSSAEMLLLWITEQKDECLCPECTEFVETSLLSFSLFGMIRQCTAILPITYTPGIRGLEVLTALASQ